MKGKTRAASIRFHDTGMFLQNARLRQITVVTLK
jgi:hypothetical protein